METQRAQWKKLSRTYDPNTGAETGVLPNKRLTAERIQKLQAIGFAWTAKPARKNSANGAASNMNGSISGVPTNPKPPVTAATSKPPPASLVEKEIKKTAQPQQQPRRNRLNDAQWEGKCRVRKCNAHLVIPAASKCSISSRCRHVSKTGELSK